MKKKWTMESWFYLFLVISPFLDAFSFLFRQWFPEAVISPTTVLRPIIPLILLGYLFFSDRSRRKEILLGGCLYLLYSVGHLYFYVRNLTDSAYGGWLYEAQYLLNYTYMIALFYIVFVFLQEGKLKEIPKYAWFFLLGYVFLIYLSIVTGTSSHTYIDGVGYKGWNVSGNAVCSVLLLSLCLVLSNQTKGKRWCQWLLILLAGFYLMFLIGSRSGLLGFPFVLVAYALCYVIFGKRREVANFFHRHWWKIGIGVVIIIALGIFFLKESSTFDRQENLKKGEGQVVDAVTGEQAHITGDATKYVKEIQDGMSTEFMSKAQQQALVALYEKGEEWGVVLDRRTQQLIYHTYLIKYQKDPFRLLFGNGYLANYDEMTLEMEVPAILYNFGILGFFLYLVPFLWIEVKAMKTLWKERKKVDYQFAFYLFGTLFALVLSFFAGYTFFHVSSMLIIILIHCLLNQKRKELES